MSIEAETEPQFTEQEITKIQQLDWVLRLFRTLDKNVYEGGPFVIKIADYPLTINRLFVDTWTKKYIFTALWQPFIDTGHADLPKDVYLASMESQR